MPDGIMIRPMRDADVASIRSLKWDMNLHDAALHAAAGNPLARDFDTGSAAATRSVDRHIAAARAGSGGLFVATLGSDIVGYLALLFEEGSPSIREHARRHGFVAGLVVAHGHRGRGIGARLIEEARRACRTRGLTRLILSVSADNEAARRFYAREGFAAVSLTLVQPLDGP